ncbi:MAG: LPS assembly lipoprotein LptE [Thiohalocapsa sp.]
MRLRRRSVRALVRGARGIGAAVSLLALMAQIGCGFHLRGAVDIPPELSPLFIQSGGVVGEAIEARLAGSGVGLTANPADAGMVLRIRSQSRTSRVVAVDIDGKALAYVLTYRVSFDARDGTGKSLVPVQTLALDRTFDDNPNVAVLGKELESDIIYQDLASDAADQVLLRLRAALANRQSG